MRALRFDLSHLLVLVSFVCSLFACVSSWVGTAFLLVMESLGAVEAFSFTVESINFGGHIQVTRNELPCISNVFYLLFFLSFVLSVSSFLFFW
jgi:hypothetical protein